MSGSRVGVVTRAAVIFSAAAAAVAAAPPPMAAAQQRCQATALSSPAALDRPTAAERTLRFRDAWPLSDGSGITIAIIDTGVADHPRLGGVADGGDVTGGPGAHHDCDAHGTFVAALAAGRPGDDGFAGVAPGASLLSIRQTADGQGDLSTLATTIDGAVAAGARVINISLTACAPPGVIPIGGAEVTDAVQRADAGGAVIVAASGNSGGTCPDGAVAWPAVLDGVLAVTAADGTDATDASDATGASDAPGAVAAEPGPGAGSGSAAETAGDHVPAGYAITGDWVDVAAPGGPVLGPAPDGETWADLHSGNSTATPIMGTSFAAPLVSGTAALVLARDPSLSPARVREIIMDTASPAATPSGIGAGIVDPLAAVARAGVTAPAGSDGETGPDGAAASAQPGTPGTDPGTPVTAMAAIDPPTPPARRPHAPTNRITALVLIAALIAAGHCAWSAGSRTSRSAPPRG